MLYIIAYWRKKFIIINKTGRKNKVGHWLLILQPNTECVEFFDSLGGNGRSLKRLRKYSPVVLFNESRVQGHSSQNCGLFCVYVAYWRLLNIDQTFSESMADIFTTNFAINDNIVVDFMADYNAERQ